MARMQGVALCVIIAASMSASPAKTSFTIYKNMGENMAEKQMKQEAHPKFKDVDNWRPPTTDNLKEVDASQVKAPKALAKAAATVTMTVTDQKKDEMATIGKVGIASSDIDKFDNSAIFTIYSEGNYLLDLKVPINESRTIQDPSSQKYYKITATEALAGYTMSSMTVSYTVEQLDSAIATNPNGLQLHKGEVFTLSSSNAPSIGVSLSDVDRITGEGIFMFFNATTGRYLTQAKVKAGEIETINAGGSSFDLKLNDVAAGISMSDIFADFELGTMIASSQRSNVTLLQKNDMALLTNGNGIALTDVTLDGTAMMTIYSNMNDYQEIGSLNVKVGTSKSLALSDGTTANVEVAEVGVGYTLSTIYAALKITGVSVYSTVFANESLELSSGYKVKLGSITTAGANLEILDSSSTKIGALTGVKENSMYTISLGAGKTAKLAVGSMAQGYTMGTMWIALAELPSGDTAVKAGAKAQKTAGQSLFTGARGIYTSKVSGEIKFINPAGRTIATVDAERSKAFKLDLKPGVYIAQFNEKGKMRAQPLEITK